MNQPPHGLLPVVIANIYSATLTAACWSLLHLTLAPTANAQFKEVGPPPFSPTVARQKIRTSLEKIDPGNPQQTVDMLNGLVPWYRDILDEELIAGWQRDGRANLTQVIEPLADARVASAIVDYSWRQAPQATFNLTYAPMLGHLMARYPDSAKPFLADLLGPAANGQQTLNLSHAEAEAVCRILLDMPDIGTWKKSALQILPHYRLEAERLLAQDVQGDDREKSYRAQMWQRELGVAVPGTANQPQSPRARPAVSQPPVTTRAPAGNQNQAPTLAALRCRPGANRHGGQFHTGTTAPFSRSDGFLAAVALQRSEVRHPPMQRRRHPAKRRVRLPQSAAGEHAARLQHKDLGRAPRAWGRTDAKVDSQKHKLRTAEALCGALECCSIIKEGAMRTLLLIVWQFGLLAGANVFADVVTLKDGRQISGLVESGNTQEIRIKVADQSQVIDVDQVQSIQFGAASPAPPKAAPAPPKPAPAPPKPAPERAAAVSAPDAAPPAPAAVPAATAPAPAAAAPSLAASAPPSLPAPPAPAAAPASAVPPRPTAKSLPPQPGSITLPVGTEIAVRTIDRIDSKKADLNHEYAASLDDPVIVDGVEVVPANANAILRVTEVQSPGLTHRASLSTSLVAVTINGQRVNVETGKVDSKAGSQAKRTLTGTAVGAGSRCGHWRRGWGRRRSRHRSWGRRGRGNGGGKADRKRRRDCSRDALHVQADAAGRRSILSGVPNDRAVPQPWRYLAPLPLLFRARRHPDPRATAHASRAGGGPSMPARSIFW